MSHVATVDVEIKDLDCLSRACSRCGLELVRGQKTYRWFGESVGDYPLPEGFEAHELGHCDHAIRVPGSEKIDEDYRPYEVGVVARRDGKPGWSLLWDFFSGGHGLQAHVGENCGKLKQAYATEVAKATAQQKGFVVSERVLPTGAIQLVLRR